MSFTDDLASIRPDKHAFFFDIDGTLADICQRPEQVKIPAERLRLLTRLSFMSGAMAVISGRSMVDIDHLLSPLKCPAAAVHGAQKRYACGTLWQSETYLPKKLLQQLRLLAADFPGVCLEKKAQIAMTIHFRACPESGDDVRMRVKRLIADYPQFALQPGKEVVEIKPREVDKGAALHEFMGQPPFLGRIPVFVGDDLPDEVGFSAAQTLGGIGIKVGQGETCASHRLASPESVENWLRHVTSEPNSPLSHKGGYPQ
ncbi:trehalose-phosphatase [Pectobacterium actinidiae]|uniref:trehalose-phosphatase n=1 Tax=Pectobacterium actinidiae TaxID=1507808 RepID=UPI002A829BC6|nr:trehalose-phosphatase [Pectobacterium actinidiae]MDY4313845.1 trehalose-phosphatase [Pectobacterium actinidiae]